MGSGYSHMVFQVSNLRIGKFHAASAAEGPELVGDLRGVEIVPWPSDFDDCF
jgi:hypothetical protein